MHSMELFPWNDNTQQGEEATEQQQHNNQTRERWGVWVCVVLQEGDRPANLAVWRLPLDTGSVHEIPGSGSSTAAICKETVETEKGTCCVNIAP